MSANVSLNFLIFFCVRLCLIQYLLRKLFRDMSIKKQYLKTKPEANVTFQVPASKGKELNKVNLVGEFNDWDESAIEMQKLKSGAFKATVKLAAGNDYQFRYLLDGSAWENDEEADAYVPNNLTYEENSVVTV